MRGVAIACGLTVAALLAVGSPASAAPSDRQATTVGSGTLLFFGGTSTQCLVFGPIAKIKGKRGVVCFKGRPRQRAASTRWAMTTPTSVTSSDSSQGNWVIATSNTTIRSTRTMPLNTTFTLAGVRYTRKGRPAELGCRFQVIRGSPDPGGKAVICADLSQGQPTPGGGGFVMTQRYVAVVTFKASDGSASIDVRWRQPPCTCDK